jgi:hypothetical protein
MADFNLPNEIWCKIFSFLPLEPKKNATATCKLWSRLIREDPNLSGHILISWYILGRAQETLHEWNWSNWPALKTLELNKFELVDSREAIQNIIKTLSLRECPPNIEKVLFNVDLTPIQTNSMSLLQYQPNTDKIFGLGQELDSIEKWNIYESNMKALKRLKSMGYRGRKEPLERILAKLEATSDPSNDLVLLIQKIRLIWDESSLEELQMGYVFGNGYHLEQELVQYMELDEFLEEFDLR